MRNFLILQAVMIALQLLTFLPFYIIYRKDCKEIGKNLAVSLHERFLWWCITVPLWAIPIAIYLR